MISAETMCAAKADAQPPTAFISSDYILDPWLAEIGAQLRERGYRVIDGPRQHPPTKIEFKRADWEAFFGKTDVVVMTTRSLLPREVLEHAPALRGVVFPTIGTESIDLQAANELGVVVANGPTPENFNSMAESTVLLMLALMYDLHGTERVLRENAPRPATMRARMLMGKTVGLVGLGRIGAGVAARLANWGVRVLAVTRSMDPGRAPPGVELVGLDELLSHSDVVSIHTTLTAETHHMIGAEQLARMKSSAFLVNTSRGGVIDERALTGALRARSIAGAALDAFDAEPLPADSPLRTLENVILTPHMVGHTQEIYAAIPGVAVENVERIMRGEAPLYCRNPEALDAWKLRMTRVLKRAAV